MGIACDIVGKPHPLSHSRGSSSARVAPGLSPIGGAAPVTKRCTLYEALHPLRSAAPDQNGCNAYRWGAPPLQQQAQTRSRPRRFSLIGNIQPDQKGLNLTDQMQPTTTSSSADRRAFLASTPRPFRAPVPGRREHSARTREAGARHELPAGISGSFTQSRT